MTGAVLASYWQLTLETDEQTLAFEAAIDVFFTADAMASHKTKAGRNALQVWFQEAPDTALLDSCVSRSFVQPQAVAKHLTYIQDHDFLTENRNSFPPLSIGRFWIYGSHVDQPVPAGYHALQIDAAQAFGSGTHPTTKGCLLALTALCCRRRTTGKLLDLGCGSAILAMAGLRLFPAARALAADNDILSVRTACQNRHINGLSPLMLRIVHSHGFSNQMLRRSGPYDLILANILAAPLREIAADTVRHLAPGGRLVLSGLLAEQTAWVMQAYTARKMIVSKRIDIDGWTTLILKKRGIGQTDFQSRQG